MRRFFFALLAFAFFACGASAQTRVFLTSATTGSTTWTVPSDWNSQQNTIEIVGSGAYGNDQGGITSWGGGGGAYAAISNLTLTPGATVNLHFDVPTDSGSSGLTWFSSSSTVAAESGHDGGNATFSGAGGRASASVGTTKFSGGAGGTGSGAGAGTGSGGGAAGPHGAGGTPVGDSSIGGTADNGFGGLGGNCIPVVTCTSATTGTEWDATHGTGGGAGSGTGGALGIPAAVYGGGGGYEAPGAQGLIIITYTPHRRVSSSAF